MIAKLVTLLGIIVVLAVACGGAPAADPNTAPAAEPAAAPIVGETSQPLLPLKWQHRPHRLK
jgi:hypothetical protein